MLFQLIVVINNQEDLDRAVELVDINERMRSLRVFLTRDDDLSLSPSQAPPGKLGELFENHSQPTVSRLI